MTVIPLHVIEAKTKEISLAELLVKMLLAIPMLVGWSAAKVWLVLTWFVAAIVVGWENGTGKAGKSGDTR